MLNVVNLAHPFTHLGPLLVFSSSLVFSFFQAVDREIFRSRLVVLVAVVVVCISNLRLLLRLFSSFQAVDREIFRREQYNYCKLMMRHYGTTNRSLAVELAHNDGIFKISDAAHRDMGAVRAGGRGRGEAGRGGRPGRGVGDGWWGG